MSNSTITRPRVATPPARLVLTGPLVVSCGVCRETVPAADTYQCVICRAPVCDVETQPCVNYGHPQHDGRGGHDDRVCDRCAETDAGAQCLTDPEQDDSADESYFDLVAGR